MAAELTTATAVQQAQVEKDCRALYSNIQRPVPADYGSFLVSSLVLQRDKHVRYLQRGLKHLSGSYCSLDASRPWLCYWILHSLAILGRTLTDPDDVSHCADFLRRCQDGGGGFGGGPGQLPHLAPTYAAVCALVTLGSREALDVVDRKATYGFLMRMKDPASGGFRMHEDGEVDVRGCYTALAVAHILNMLTLELTRGVSQFVRRCQTYEGGMGGEPGAEAHGGYTFCGLASALLLGCAHELDLPTLLRWAVHRQGTQEGGFQGRTNKLVDGCYSYWQGALFCLFQHPQLQRLLGQQQQRRYGGIIPVPKPGCEGSSALDEESREDGNGVPGTAGWRGAPAMPSTGGPVPPRGVPTPAAVHAVELEAAAWLFAGSRRIADVVQHAFVERATCAAGRHPVLLEVESEYSPSDASVRAEFTGSLVGERAASSQVGAAPCADPASVAAAAAGVQGADDHEGVPMGPSGVADPLLAGGPASSVEQVKKEEDEDEDEEGEDRDDDGSTYFNVLALQGYLLVCCQVPEGGLRDKPGKSRDYYHTCYCLSGLAAAQHTRQGPSASSCGDTLTLDDDIAGEAPLPLHTDVSEAPRVEVLGSPLTNLVKRTNPLCNIHERQYEHAVAYFKQLPPPAAWT